MKNILDKLSKEEIKQLSKAINKAQEKSYGNPLSLRKQEEFMANTFNVKNWSTLLGLSQQKPKDNEELGYKTSLHFEVIGREEYQYSNLDQLKYDTHFGDFLIYLKEESSTPLNHEELENETSEAASDINFFNMISREERTLIEYLLNKLNLDPTEKDIFSLLEDEFENLRAFAVTKLNRGEEELTTIENIIIQVDNLEYEIFDTYLARFVEE